ASSRLIENQLHLVLISTPNLPSNQVQDLQNMPLEDWIPDYQVASADGAVIGSGDMAGWQDFYRPGNPDGYSITTIVTIDISDPQAPFTTTAISADAGLVYASPDALYIADTGYNYDDVTF